MTYIKKPDGSGKKCKQWYGNRLKNIFAIFLYKINFLWFKDVNFLNFR